MYLGGGINQIGGSDFSNVASGLGQTKMIEADMAPRFFYSLMLCSGAERKNRLEYSNAHCLGQMMVFVQDTSLKKDMCKAIRDMKFRSSHNNHRSIIINEVSGLYNLTKSAIAYGVATVKVYIG